MRFINFLLLGFLVLLNGSSGNLLGASNKSINEIDVKPDMYVISIGINKYIGHTLSNCVNDANAILEKIKKDNEYSYSDPTVNYKIRKSTSVTIGETYTYGFYDNMATIKNIKNAFNEVIKKSKPNDYFVLFYAGLSLPVGDVESAFVLFQETEINYDNPKLNNIIKISELASLMTQISSDNQLIISESCYGKASSQKLMSYMFESNPLIAINNKRNRIIITVSDIGYDASSCNQSHAPLASYVLKNENIIHAFENIEAYEYNLQKSHIECPSKEETYFIVRQESDFRDLLLNNYEKANSRGSKPKNVKENINSQPNLPKTFAFIVATDEYNENQTSWNNLKNPINDAEAVSKILKSKYNTEVIKVYNPTKENLLKEFIKLKKRIDKRDKLIFFVAGHGYYSNDYSDGLIVLNDSFSLEDDTTFQSYLPMAVLNKLLDGLPCKQVFSIFDVCYGASFELNNADLAMENYSNTEFDNGIEDFISQTDKKYSRIMLASGKYEVPDYWNNSLDHSPFADKLITALENEDTFISPGKIYSYVRGNATTPILKRFGKHETTGDFLLKVLN